MGYYALFEDRDGRRFRFDTRVYLCDCEDHKQDDGKGICLGAFVGLNPGSAEPFRESDVGTWTRICADGTLRLIRCCFLGAAGEEAPQQHAFVQVWNLFYLCDPESKRAVPAARKLGPPRPCPREGAVNPKVVWFGWGRSPRWTENREEHFIGMNHENGVYYENKNGSPKLGKLEARGFAGHPARKPKAAELEMQILIRRLLNSA